MNTDLTKSVNNAVGMPLVTVAMPIYNAGSYLRLAVLSIVSQTYANWQLLIIDDGSTDNALRSINDINDNRIKIISDGENKGLAARLNQAIDLAEGDFFARMDQDDISYPQRFEKQLSALSNDESLDMVCVRALAISETDEPVGYLPYQLTHSDICAKPWRSFHMPHPTWMGRISWFKKHRYSAARPYFCEDQELLLRSYQSSKFGSVPDILFAYRLRSKNNTKKIRKIRYAILCFQLKQFIAIRSFGYAGLSLINYFMNMVRDFFRANFASLYFPYKATKVNTFEIEAFNKILTRIKDNHA